MTNFVGIVWFRFAVLISVLCVIGGWLTWGQAGSRTKELEATMREAEVRMADATLRCDRGGRAACAEHEYYRSQQVKAYVERDEITNRVRLVWVVALGVSAALMFLFYSIRWGITGRLLPLYPGQLATHE